MEAKNVKTIEQAFEFYQKKAHNYLELIYHYADIGDEIMAKLMVGFYNSAVRDMETFEGLM